MKLLISSSIFLFSLTSAVFANNITVKPETVTDSGKFYVGVFGGLSASNNFNGSQYGTVFFIEGEGGPLSVNAFGKINNQNSSLFGAQLGYQTQGKSLNCSSWTLGSAAELEGYTINKSSFDGDLSNNIERIPEHEFVVSYPMRRTVFLTNAVLNFNNPRFQFHPYIGLGVGSTVVKISGASSTQISPAEEGVNHYNTNTGDTNSTFAGQAKLGLSYDINKYVSFFADYRWLYLANTHFVFGSTVIPDHAETTSWQVGLDAQKYNVGNIGVRFSW
ncbi:MAG: P44/Msp2 family outer membrane protein [Pseudomonadota bacterium]